MADKVKLHWQVGDRVEVKENGAVWQQREQLGPSSCSHPLIGNRNEKVSATQGMGCSLSFYYLLQLRTSSLEPKLG